MPACRQCGKENPEGTAFCGYCATALARPTGDPTSPPPAPKPAGNPVSSGPARGAPPPEPKPFRPETRTSARAPSSDGGRGKGGGGFELIPWSELSANQRIGRSIFAFVGLLLVFFFFRTIIRGMGGSGTSASVPSAQSSNAPITDSDRKDGIESLCKVFQIYGLPKTDHDATEAANNAGQLFKLAGNQPPERSEYILTSIVQEFRGGKLGSSDCEEAGAPVPTNEANPNPDNSTPDVQR
jgi:hypothetical protein